MKLLFPPSLFISFGPVIQAMYLSWWLDGQLTKKFILMATALVPKEPFFQLPVPVRRPVDI